MLQVAHSFVWLRVEVDTRQDESIIYGSMQTRPTFGRMLLYIVHLHDHEILCLYQYFKWKHLTIFFYQIAWFGKNFQINSFEFI